MDDTNPYAPPTVAWASGRRPQKIVRRRLAGVMLAFSIVGSLLYVYVDEVLLRSSVGAWPMLFATSGIAILASFLTRDWIVAPLCCFLGTMSGDLLASVVRSWAYAQVEYCLLLAAGFSVPSLVIAIAMYRTHKRRAVAFA